MDPVQQIHQLGQSIWYDNIQRGMLLHGHLKELVQGGVIRGVTSNPSIFQNAIANSDEYDPEIQNMSWSGLPAEEIYLQLAIEDIKNAADLFLPLYKTTAGHDGFVSLEVSPKLAMDTEATVREAQELWRLINRPNLMIKIPATTPGLPAMTACLEMGININATLIFSLQRYREVIEAYFLGLERRIAKGLPIKAISSVASFFVSRLDTVIDGQLQALIPEGSEHSNIARNLLGKAAIANARLAYEIFGEQFNGERFEWLRSRGAQIQRPLWASTSTKNPDYRDVRYVEELIGPNSVNTIPPQTLRAFQEHGNASLTIQKDLEISRSILNTLEQLGISLDEATAKLERDGVQAFNQSYSALLEAIDEKRSYYTRQLGPLKTKVPRRIANMKRANLVQRMFSLDGSLWTNDAAGKEEVRNRLGWLYSPSESLVSLEKWKSIADEIKKDFHHVLLIGMGGSSLAAEVFSRIQTSDHPECTFGILDSTHPCQIRDIDAGFPPGKTFYIVSSKSGATLEVNAFFKHFWDREVSLGNGNPGGHFMAITDPGTPLEKLALEKGFRWVIHGDPKVGGRFSALTAFGLIPALINGWNGNDLLEDAQLTMNTCLPDIQIERNPGAVLGAVLSEAFQQGMDKLTILSDPGLECMGSWLEQLIAESSGKEGKGVVPVVLEPLAAIDHYGRDRYFIYLKFGGENNNRAQELLNLGFPVLTFSFETPNRVGGEFYCWEFATAILCSSMNVNAFDQPNVQESKTISTKTIEHFLETGELDDIEPFYSTPEGSLSGNQAIDFTDHPSLAVCIRRFLQLSQQGDYIAINAYLPMNESTIDKLQNFRKMILGETGCATTLGFGPRFQHSTGQLQKGGAGNGLILQITSELHYDLPVPGTGYSFSTLIRSQAIGDLKTLMRNGRRVMRVHLETDDDISRLIVD